MAVNDQLFIPWPGVIKHHHAFRADHGELLLLEWIQPTHEYVGAQIAGKLKGGQRGVGHPGGEM